MLRRRRRRMRGLSIHALVPNAVTVLGMCAGLSAIRFAVAERWQVAVALVILAGIIDGLDGRIARVLKASSEFGAQLDSLSDFLCFGVAPAAVLYLWTLHVGGGAGWAVALLFAVCMGLRLARYNASLSDPERPAWSSRYFTGMPAPAAGGMILLPMMVSFEFGDAVFREPILVALHAVGVSFLTVSTIPMYSGKGMRLKHEHFVPALLLVGLFFAAIIGYPWHTFALLGVGYLGSIPFSIRSQRRFKAEMAAAAEAPEDDDAMIGA